MKNIIIIAKREYLKIVKSKGFLLSTLFLPILMVVVSLISGLSGQGVDDKIQKEIENISDIYILDDSNIVNPMLTVGFNKDVIITNYDEGKDKVLNGELNAFVYFPADVLESKNIEVYTKDSGLISSGIYEGLISNLVKSNVMMEVQDVNKLQLSEAKLNIKTNTLKDGKFSTAGFSQFVVPIISLFLYIMFTSTGSGYLLASVSEEKENRMIEIILCNVSSKELITAKLLGQIGVVLTQLAIWALAGLIIFKLSSFTLPIDLSTITISIPQLLLAILFLFAGFFILGFSMIGVGASMPTYKEASSFSSVFIMLSIFPMYFIPILMTEPYGTISMILSYFPFSAPLVLLLRVSLDALPVWEIILSTIVLILWIIVFAFIAFKLFEYGAMSYDQKISLKKFFRTLNEKRHNK